MIVEFEKEINLIREDKEFKSQLCICSSSYGDIDILIKSLSNIELKEYFLKNNSKTKFIYSLGRYCAKKAVSYLVNERSLDQITITSGIFNQPVVKKNSIENIQISLSHVNNVAISIAFPEEHPMGIDIEEISMNNNNVLISQFLNDELKLINSLHIDISTALTIMWTAKESISKVLRTELTVPLSILAIKNIEKVNTTYVCYFENFPQYKTFSWVGNNYVYSICLPKFTKISSELEYFF